MTWEELRAIDARVHLEVMGADPHETAVMQLCAQGDTGACQECGGRDVPAYSIDIAAAWRVVGAIKKRPSGMRHDWAITTHRDVWQVSVWQYAGDATWSTGDIEAATAPLAICLAALKVVEAKA